MYVTYGEGLPKSNHSRDGVNQSKAAQHPSILAEKTHGFCCQLPGKFSHFLFIGIINIYNYIHIYIYTYIYIYTVYFYIYIYSDVNGTIARKFPQHLHRYQLAVLGSCRNSSGTPIFWVLLKGLSLQRWALSRVWDSDRGIIWVNYNDLTATSLESWLIREIIPKWP